MLEFICSCITYIFHRILACNLVILDDSRCLQVHTYKYGLLLRVVSFILFSKETWRRQKFHLSVLFLLCTSEGIHPRGYLQAQNLPHSPVVSGFTTQKLILLMSANIFVERRDIAVFQVILHEWHDLMYVVAIFAVAGIHRSPSRSVCIVQIQVSYHLLQLERKLILSLLLLNEVLLWDLSQEKMLDRKIVFPPFFQ